MLEKLLSRSAFKIYFAAFILMMAYAAWMRFTNSGIIGWLDWLQTYIFRSGYYYPEVSFVILLIPAIAISFGFGFLFDFVTGQGIFAAQQQIPEDLDPEAFITYRLTNRTDVIEKVRAKYQASIQQLRELGFADAGFHRESVARLGLAHGLLGLGGAIGFLGNEVTSMGPNMTVSAYFPLMTYRDYSTFAATFALGTSFFTLFTDGTCLVSSNYQGTVISDEAQKLFKNPVARPLPAAWQEHKNRIRSMQLQGKQIRDDLSFLSFAAMSRRLDDYVIGNESRVMKASQTGPSTGSVVISTIGALGILVGLVLAWMLFDNILANLMPSCWFVRNMRLMPVGLHFLAVAACFALSWVLARFRQDDLFTVDGIGMQLLGRDRLPGTDQYITTKWLVLPWVPLIPVRSYELTIQDSGPVKGEVLAMQPLNGINWEQVRATARKSWLAYLIFAAIFLAFPVWSVAECI